MRLILVRHGRPNEGDPGWQNDPPLNADGWRQARAAARLLASERITRVVASPLLLAHQTGGAARRAAWAADGKDRGLGRSGSAGEPLPLDGDAARGGGEAWARFLQDPIRYLGAEPDRFRNGVLQALRDTAATETETSRVAVFTHGLPINVVLSHALGLAGIAHFLVGCGSVTRIRRRDDGDHGVSSVNETGHHKAHEGEQWESKAQR